ncbi:MAG: hypothetical protein HS122_03910 [Opitutaceae bacterium]|nr:hypothetical protein [Opitutaceae bacterium]
MLRVLAIYRLLAPGSEWRLHRQWFGTSALPDLLGVDERSAQPATLYRCLDLLLAQKEALFGQVAARFSAMPICLVYAAQGTSPPYGVNASSVTESRTRPPAVGNVNSL